MGKFADMILHLEAAYVSLFDHFYWSIEGPGRSTSAGLGMCSHCIFNRHGFSNKIAFCSIKVEGKCMVSKCQQNT